MLAVTGLGVVFAWFDLTSAGAPTTAPVSPSDATADAGPQAKSLWDSVKAQFKRIIASFAKYLPAMQKVVFKGVTGNIAFDAKGDIKEGGVSLYRYADGKWEPLK